MAAETAIEWCDSTWNCVRGCTRVSPGCGGPNHEGGCYAEKIAARFSDPGQPFHGFAERTPHGGRWTGKLALIDSQLDLPLRWRKPRRIFVNSMSDLFHESLPFEDIDKVFAVMGLAAGHTFQVLTKRADRMREYMTEWLGKKSGVCSAAQTIGKSDLWATTIAKQLNDGFLRNVWLGVSVEDQARADERIPALLDTPAAIRFLSCEPLLGPLDLSRYLAVMKLKLSVGEHWTERTGEVSDLHWLICGGESGPHARPMHPDWARSLRDQCAAADVPFFFKQWGEHMPFTDWQQQPPGPEEATFSSMPSERVTIAYSRDDGMVDTRAVLMARIGKKRAGAMLDGREHRQFPEAR